MFVILLPPAHPFPLVTLQHIISIFQIRQGLLCTAPSPRFPCPGPPEHPVCTIHSYEKHPDPICHSHTATLSLQGPAWRRWHQTMCLSCAKVVIAVFNKLTTLVSCKLPKKAANNLIKSRGKPYMCLDLCPISPFDRPCSSASPASGSRMQQEG